MSRNVALSHAGHWTCEARWHAAVQEKGQNVSIIDYFIGNHQLSYRLKNTMHLFWDETRSLKTSRSTEF